MYAGRFQSCMFGELNLSQCCLEFLVVVVQPGSLLKTFGTFSPNAVVDS